MQLTLTNNECEGIDRAASWTVAAGFGGFKNPEQAKLVMLLALSQGEHIGRAVHDYHVINGKLVLKSESMLSRFQHSGGTIRYTQYTDEAVTVEATHPAGGTLAVTWDIAQAKRAGLLGNQLWAKHPRAMLKARAVTEAVRALYPACLTGVMTTEEAIELQTVPVQSMPVQAVPVQAVPVQTVSVQPVSAPEAETHEVCEASVFDQLDHLFFESDHLEINGFLARRGKITKSQTYRDLDPAYAKLILRNPERFFDALEKHATENTSSRPALVASNN